MRTFFVSSVTWGRRSLFRNEHMALLFIEKMSQDRRVGRYQVHEFVLMPDHFHLVITPSSKITLERALQFLKGGFSFLAKKRLGSNAEIWQAGFAFETVQSQADYERIRDYIWQNPVRRGLVSRPEEYRWSSASGEFDVDAHPFGTGAKAPVPMNAGAPRLKPGAFTESNPLADDLDRILARTPQVWQALRGERLFLTGGTGFFGCWLLETIAWANARLHSDISATVLSRDPDRFRQRAPHLAANPAFQFHAGDVRTFAFPEGRFSHIIHAATAASADLNDQAPLAMLETIVAGTRRCLGFAAHCGARRFLLASSGAVYGAQPARLRHLPETYAGGPDPLDVHSAYAEGKRLAELECALAASAAAAAAGAALEVKMARGFAFVGPYMNLDAHFAIGNFIRDGLRGGPIRVQGDGKPLRSYMYAGDLMAWLWTILHRGASGRAYNVGSEEAISIARLANVVARTLGLAVEVEIAGAANRAGAAGRYVPSTARAREELGLACEVGLEEAIRKTAKWFRTCDL
jgi:dTDP-glucose 4,6-dehydratase